MIYTVTLNPSLDYIMHLDNFKEGETNRSNYEDIYVGGKGFNVSTILSRLNMETIALGFIAGFVGEEIERQLHKRGFQCDLCKLDSGVSRINVKIKGQKETEINGNGPLISQKKLDELLSKLNHIEDGDTVVLAGSIPSSLPHNIYERIIQSFECKDIRFVVDATNELLMKVLPYHPFLIKPNLRELEELFDVQITSQEDIVTYAKQLQKQGARNVLVSLGKDGALLVAEDGHIYGCDAAKGELKNSVGSGDSMVAGFLAGYIQSHDYQRALLLGSACGGATAMSDDLAETELIDCISHQLQIIEY